MFTSAVIMDSIGLCGFKSAFTRWHPPHNLAHTSEKSDQIIRDVSVDKKVPVIF